jgi:hypothetical protein
MENIFNVCDGGQHSYLKSCKKVEHPSRKEVKEYEKDFKFFS